MCGKYYSTNIWRSTQKCNYRIFPFSILGIDSAVEEPRELHVDIPEEQETTATIGSNVEQQPPSYIEEQETTATIASNVEQQPPSYTEEQETTAAISSNVEQQPPSYQEAMSKICDTSNNNEEFV